MTDARATNPLVEQFRRGGIARDLRLMGAQGLLPLAPADLTELWCILLRTPTRESPTPPGSPSPGSRSTEFAPIAKDRSTPEAVLEWVVTDRPERELRGAGAPEHLDHRRRHPGHGARPARPSSPSWS